MGSNNLDKYSSFRQPLRKINARVKAKGYPPTDITLDYLRDLWFEQDGICPFTGWEMHLPESTTEWDDCKTQPDWASLDRIDSSKGYLRGNIRYITYMANIAKNTFSDEQLIEFCRAVGKTNK